MRKDFNVMSLSVREQPHNQVLRERFLGNQRRITFSFLVIFTFASSLLFLYVYQHMQLLELVNHNEKLKRRIAALEKLSDKYQQEEVMLSSLQRIEFIAREQLGMRPPMAKDRLYLNRKEYFEVDREIVFNRSDLGKIAAQIGDVSKVSR